MAALIALSGPFIAGTIVQSLGYQPLFAAALVLALGALVVAVRHLRDARMGVWSATL